MQEIHTPVLTEELKVLLNLKPGDNAVDATLNGGGHARMMLELIKPGGKVLGIDQDKSMIERMEGDKNITAIWGNFKDIDEIIKKLGFNKIKAVLFDLGMSRWHLEQSGRGFSFQKPEEALFMNLNKKSANTAAEILNGYPEDRLAEIFKNFGQEPKARLFAKKIMEFRKKQPAYRQGRRIISVKDLLNALGAQKPDGREKILARIFQALRIAVNNELEALTEALPKSFDALDAGGRLAIISYHSLEDRIVKNFFSAVVGKKAIILTKKPKTASQEEIIKNPSSRSAKLRVLEKI
ncbi:MAG: Ribosomal RNA small subunit methyltransferase H [Candidatus Giovannonibacteria bacterium GW2011_GWC2_44_9]|uniref:Ribosomal RNA small subunit methyltransferase H n=3 Tax=Candidatus Giovannoniibacteriota TaxID=1752738 RepID=A0A0G1L5N3_9BACT|nr:MAG: Ribosomal RNA small subunit methyltransferase H [Candidatus Giovannonibacteria bacterium GW2011_GWB1_44_23]KKT63912.1 MAG: Ribosomal RNA small subunit methyltransferase H [Candidatus Giovannonibacteria bacterium GW2011_GWA1_44_29]KKT83175.1 MAG: Ribosomal RNA small subunit methyltransferase H [Candidatus Giovannonibacteria bacterium GW2011_GWC2_44_9]KKT91625.1 MAG: Ribosomal RNA small subunit methyltransferase H [Parcubacteria group bacterium GW2011_GWC1_45_13]